MKLSVKNVRMFRGMEGFGFNATLYIDGRKSGLVIDEGNGGAYHYQIPASDLKLLENYAALQPERVLRIGNQTFNKTYKPGIDTIVGELVSDFEISTKIRRLCKSNIVFSLKNDTPGNLWTVKGEYSPESAQSIRDKHGNNLAVIHNEIAERYVG